MVGFVKFFIFAHGNIVPSHEGASYDREPSRKIRVRTDASYEDLRNAICTGLKIDPTPHQIEVRHRHPKSVEGRVRYSLVPILDDTDVEDLVEMAEKMGEGSIQELYVEISNRSIAFHKHKTWQVDAVMPSTFQVSPSMHDPARNEDFMHQYAPYEIYWSKDDNNIKREIDHILEDPPTEMGKNHVIADLGNEDPAQNLMIHKLRDPTAYAMLPSPMSANITYGMEDCNQTSRTSSSTTPPGQDYEVFLSFRGEDTRLHFTDHLYKGLVNVGVWVFKDNELRVGEMIGPKLLKAIKGSRISIPIISPGYASSMWCLKELVQILQCMRTSGQIVLPIFYRVKPSEVRNQIGDFGNGLLCKKKHDVEGKLVQEWKKALMEVASLKGWESANGHEGELVQNVVDRVLEVLRKATLPIANHLVGVEHHVEKIIEWATNAKGSSTVQAVVVHGMGGVGKTTLAKVVYNRLYDYFEHSSFIANIHETSQHKGMEVVQKQLISNILGKQQDISNIDEGANIIKARCNRKKVLILLDDVNHRDQLNSLVGESDWYGRGSVILITSRNKDVLGKWELSFHYELNSLDIDHSFMLFYKHAFKENDSCLDELGTLAKKIVSTTGGLPLAIETIGSYLCGKEKYIWEDTLKILEGVPHDDVQRKLIISFDALHPDEKEIFLDISCLPICEDRELAIYMWVGCGFHKQRINNLISMSIIKYGEKKNLFIHGQYSRYSRAFHKLILMSMFKYGGKKDLLIHDQLRDLGREIVRQESKDGLGNCSHLWKPKDARDVLESNQGSKKVKALCIDGISCTSQQFEGMTNLRFLDMDNVHLLGDFKNLFLKLRWLRWINKSNYGDFMAINIIPRKLVVLDLYKSDITEHWKGWSQMKNLKVLKLQHCHNLTLTPDFSGLQELEILSLNNCRGLRKIHPSVGKLSKTLQVLDVCGCYNLEELPIEMGEMEELRELLLDYTRISEIPINEGYMTKLETLSAWNCDKLVYIPNSFSSLVKLQRLFLGGCKSLTKIPESIRKLELLTNVVLHGTAVTQLPDFIGDWHYLESLDMAFTNIKRLPTSIGMLSKLQLLDLEDCDKLESLPNLPYSLRSLIFNGDSIETLPDFSNLTNLNLLTYKDLFQERNGALNLGNLNQLKILRIHNSYEDVSDSKEEIDMALGNINLLPELPLGIEKLEVLGCATLQTLPNLSNLKNLSELRVCRCSELVEVNGLEGAESLTWLSIAECKKFSKLSSVGISMTCLKLESLDALKSLPDLSIAKKLKELMIAKCRNLVEIQGVGGIEGLQHLEINWCSSLARISGLEKLTSLRVISLSGCKSLQYLPDLSQFTKLEELDVEDCEKLSEIQGLGNLTSLWKLNIIGCTALRELLDLPEVCIRCERIKEEEDVEILPDLSFGNSNDVVESCEISFGCPTLRRLPDQCNVRVDPLEQQGGGYLPDLSRFRNSNDIFVKGCEIFFYL